MPKAIRITAIILLALGLLLGILAIVGIGRKAPTADSAAQATAEPSRPSRAVVVATSVLPAGKPISATDLSNTQLPVGPGEGFLNISDVVGRVPSHDIAAGAMVSPELLTQGIAAGLLPGERALAVPVDELAGVSNRVVPGDYVDVFMSLQDPEAASSGRANPQARLLLSRLRVLGYGDNDVVKQQASHASSETAPDAVQPAPGSRDETIAARDGKSGSNNDPSVQARSAILAVPVEDAGRLLLAAHSGKLFLALRNPGDTALADSSIFVAPPPVLALRRGLDAEQADTAARPENQAYAGISLTALAGDGNARQQPNPAASGPPAMPARNRAARPAPRQGIEIIRGATPSNRLSSP